MNVPAELAALDTANARRDSSTQGWVVSRYAHSMTEARSSAEITIRRAYSRDAAGISRVYLESADYHTGLDAERYYIPDAEAITARYREQKQHPPEAGEEAISFVAELAREIAGFVDVRLTRSPDPMHREMLYCQVVEIAVSSRYQGQGIGGLLLRAAEDWGRRQGAEIASLEYLAANTRASLFYERLGYRAASITAIKRL